MDPFAFLNATVGDMVMWKWHCIQERLSLPCKTTRMKCVDSGSFHLIAGQLLAEMSASHGNSLLTDQEPMESKDLGDFDITLFRSVICPTFEEVGWAADSMLLLKNRRTRSWKLVFA